MRLSSSPVPGSPAGSGDPQLLPPHIPGTFPLFIPSGVGKPRAGPAGISSAGWLLRGTAQISALSLKRDCFIREGICTCLLPLGQDNEVLLDTKHQINTRYSRMRGVNAIPNPQLSTLRASIAAWTGLMKSYHKCSCLLLGPAGPKWGRSSCLEVHGLIANWWIPIPGNLELPEEGYWTKWSTKQRRKLVQQSSQGRRGKHFLEKDGEGFVTWAQSSSSWKCSKLGKDFHWPPLTFPKHLLRWDNSPALPRTHQTPNTHHKSLNTPQLGGILWMKVM